MVNNILVHIILGSRHILAMPDCCSCGIASFGLQFFYSIPRIVVSKRHWTDEKMFVLTSETHRQNDRILAPMPQAVRKMCRHTRKRALAFFRLYSKADLRLYRGWRPPIWTPNVKLLINCLRQISAFKWTIVLYSNLCITRFIIFWTDNTFSGTHGIYIHQLNHAP